MTGTIFVYLNKNCSNILIGKLNVEVLRGKENFSFEYNPEYLETKEFFLFDPDLRFFKGRQYPSDEKPLFGIFTDSCPDRWGRQLIQRNEAFQARIEGRSVRKLNESDYLLGIDDYSRMGALRFKTNPEGPFLSPSNENSVPIWTSIRELEQAAILLDEASESDEIDNSRRLKLLLQPGSSLGGARPKASVRDSEGNLWIAKFPSKIDTLDVGAWEMVVHKLAKDCNLNVPNAISNKYSSNGTTFLVQRFDRTKEGNRIHFISAMTALGKKDGDNSDSGLSYLDIASFIQQNSEKPREDLLELWKRIVFSIAVSNTDDHLRNHGFLFSGKGLRLSPMYDVNPNPNGYGLSLNIDEYSNALDFGVAIDASSYYDIDKDTASKIVEVIKRNVSKWRYAAQSLGISQQGIEEMKVCFQC